MELLRLVTLVYAGVLVLALAVSLTAIWVYLRRIAGALGGAREAFSRVATETEHLDPNLHPLRDLSREAAEEMSAAESALESADERLSALLERLGLSAPAP